MAMLDNPEFCKAVIAILIKRAGTFETEITQLEFDSIYKDKLTLLEGIVGENLPYPSFLLKLIPSLARANETPSN
jgi:hypothetical protein